MPIAFRTRQVAIPAGTGRRDIDDSVSFGAPMRSAAVTINGFQLGLRSWRQSPGRHTPLVSALQAALVLASIVVMSGWLWRPVRGYAAAADIAQSQVECPVPICAAPIGTEFPSQVTFFSEAGLWGDSLTIEVPVSEPIETVRIVTNTELNNANLLKRISSVRLQCGSRTSQAVLFTASNMWSQFGDAQPFFCDPGQTVETNLHTDASWVADKVGSVYFVAHARQVDERPLSLIVTNAWVQQLDDLPSGAKADGEPRLADFLFCIHAPAEPYAGSRAVW